MRKSYRKELEWKAIDELDFIKLLKRLGMYRKPQKINIAKRV